MPKLSYGSSPFSDILVEFIIRSVFLIGDSLSELAKSFYIDSRFCGRSLKSEIEFEKFIIASCFYNE